MAVIVCQSTGRANRAVVTVALCRVAESMAWLGHPPPRLQRASSLRSKVFHESRGAQQKNDEG